MDRHQHQARDIICKDSTRFTCR